ncbi:wings apart-like protein 2 [Zingiber officinale]|uniref:wings apart-like protein 2 n=1 Tax=Zingiber officinale TaxID=94328 RepID=UPI001C4DAE97|nr:wings apart-like protein 2 [Zingiber officinale]XP_042378289.1 wings apart-like protein 2 [Zingiber officinale]
MIVRTYGRRSARCGGGGGGRSSSDPVLLDTPESEGDYDSSAGDLVFELPHFSQDSSSQGRHAAPFSSQDSSSPWSLDPLDVPDDFPGLPPSLLFPPPRGSEDPVLERATEARDPEDLVTTTTLMEAQEFGEMMEHMDEVNFALDGLRPWQPVRVRRASLLSLLSVCSTLQKRRLLRVRGITARIVEAILDVSLDDSPSTTAIAAIFFVLASDVQDNHLLDTPSCIAFLLKLLNPSSLSTSSDKAPTFGSKILGKRKPLTEVSASYKALDSTAKTIISKVSEILLTYKEIKSDNKNGEGIERPELSPKWIALLTMEKACLSTVSFEDATDVVKMPGGVFKEKLRELGGLNAIFDVLSSCHSTLLTCHSSSSFADLKEELVCQNLLLILKCLKIMENATFLSKQNQNHLLGLKEKLNSSGSQQSFVAVIISAIKFFSDLSLHQSNFSNSENEKLVFDDQTFQMKPKLRDGSDEPSSSHFSGCSRIGSDSEVKVIKLGLKRQKSSNFHSEVSLSGSGKAIDFSASLSCVKINRSTGDSYENDIALKTKINCSASRMISNSTSSQWISIKTNGASMNSDSSSKRPHLQKDAKVNCEVDMDDPFAFDEGDLEPSKWELLAKSKGKIQDRRCDLATKEPMNGCELSVISTDDMLSQLTNEEAHQSNATSEINEDLSLVDDCLLTSVKVLMNLTNENPLGCQQIAACGGLHTMVSIIVSHFPSFDCFFQMNGKLKQSTSTDLSCDCHLKNKHLNDHELELLVAVLGLLVNLVEKNNQNRLNLAEAHVSAKRPGKSEELEAQRDVIQLLCAIFLAHQGNKEAKDETTFVCDEESLLKGAKEAEMMIIEAYAALLLGFLSVESSKVRKAIADCLPNRNLQGLVPVLEKFVAFHLSLNMISRETHSAILKVIASCKAP